MTDQIADRDDVDDVDDGPVESGHDAEVEVTDAGAAESASRWAAWREHRRNRVSKWDRPPDPHDWRFFVGNLGKVLIATGILMFGFVAYQLWGTGIETARAQAELEDTFQEQVEAAVGEDEPELGFDSWVIPTDTSSDDPEIEAIVPTPLTEVELSDVVPGGLDLSEFAVDQNVPIVPGDSFARLDIPKIGVSEYVVPGVKLTDLKRGPGHYPDTPLPGQLGNASIAGHRTTYGAPFFDLDRLVAGDEIEVTMVTGDRFVYRITGIQIVSARDYWVVTTRDPNVAELTLTTCDPKYTARDRLVVHSVLVPEKSAQVGVAEFYQTGDEATDEPVPGDDPTLSTGPRSEDTAEEPPADETPADATPADEVESGVEAPTVDDESAPTENELGAIVDPNAAIDLTGASDEPAGDRSDADAEPVLDQPTVGPPAEDDAVGDDAVIDDRDVVAEGMDVAEEDVAEDGVPDTEHAEDESDLEEIDAFSQGWFDDGDAWPQIALWGFALTIISLLAYQVSKKTRHDSIGFMVGIAPFLFCLYFFFQNVNRLLPPGL